MSVNTIPHLALPLVLGADGTFITLQQDTPAEVAQCVSVLVGTQLGQRSVVPDFGVSDPTFANPNANEIVEAIEAWEPRAAPTVSVTLDVNGNPQVLVQVSLAQDQSF